MKDLIFENQSAEFPAIPRANTQRNVSSSTHRQQSTYQHNGLQYRPIPSLSASDLLRFWKKVDRSGGPDACWLWKSKPRPDGKSHRRYGSFRIGPKTYHPHRISYFLIHGPIPPGLTIDHVSERCRVGGRCVNPAHMELVTQEENHRRYYMGVNRCKNGHPYEPLSGGCKLCQKAHRKALYKRTQSKPAECRLSHPTIPLSNDCPACQRLMARYRGKSEQMEVA